MLVRYRTELIQFRESECIKNTSVKKEREGVYVSAHRERDRMSVWGERMRENENRTKTND